VLNSLLTDKSSSRARLSKTELGNFPKTDNNDISSSRARLNKTKVDSLPKTDNSDNSSSRATLPVPKPIDKDLPNTPDARLSPEKQKEYNNENDKVVKRLKVLLA